MDEPGSWFQLGLVAIGSSAAGAFITSLFSRSKQKADVTSSTITNALELERRAMDRYSEAVGLYEGALESLDVATCALNAARQQLRNQKYQLDIYRDYVLELQGLLTQHGIQYKQMSPFHISPQSIQPASKNTTVEVEVTTDVGLR